MQREPAGYGHLFYWCSWSTGLPAGTGQDHQSKSFRTSGGLLDSRPRAKAITVIAEDADGVLIPLLVLGKSSDHGNQHNHPVGDVRYQLMQ